MPKGQRRGCEIGAEIMAALLHHPRTEPELKAQVGMGNATSERWLEEYRASGVIRICAYERHGKWTRVFAVQTTPFALPDAPRPAEAT